jgi:hypothetical protein
MQNHQSLRHLVLPYFLVTLGVLLVFALWTLAEQQVLLASDSGIFLYTGQQIAAGKRLYVDVWDHKPPLIFWWNALGFLPHPSSPAGVLAVLFAHVWAATLLLFHLLQRYVDSVGAALAIPLFLAALAFQLSTPNFTETYALPWQALLALLGFRLLQPRSPALPLWRHLALSFLAGLAAASLFALRPNNVVASLFFGACVLLSDSSWRTKLLSLASAALGCLLCLGLIALPFWLGNSLSELLYATFGFNMLYAQQGGNAKRLAALVYGSIQLTQSSFLPFTLAALLYSFIQPRKRASLCGAWFVLELLLANLSGRAFNHYYVTTLIAGSCLIATAFDTKAASLEAVRLLRSFARAITLLFSAHQLWALRPATRQELLRESPQVRRLEALLPPGSSYHYWGSDARMLWHLLRRPIPARLFHTTPLLANQGQYQALIPGLLQDLLAHPPAWIVESPARGEPPLAPGPWDTAQSTELKNQLLKRYRVHSEVEGECFWKLQP